MKQRPCLHGRHPRYWIVRGIALLLLLFLYAQLLGAATLLSATVDEGFHITSGYEYLRTGKLRLFDEHAPLAKALFGWPLFFVPDLSPPETADGYASGDLIAVAQATVLAYRPLDRVIVAPRLAAVLLTLVVAATLYRCAASFAGQTAGLFALFLCAFDPNFLAHGSLATTDMSATAFSFWAVWAGVRWLQRPTRRRWVVGALFLGLAQGAKLTALLVYPVLGLGVLLTVAAQWCDGAKHSTMWKLQLQQSQGKILLAFTGMVGFSLLVLWALYGFELRALPGVFGGAVPLPAAGHIERWLRLQANLGYGREAFLLGQNAMHGWPQYFPIAFLVKTPLPLLILLAVLLLHSVYRISRFTIHVSRFTPHVSRLTFYLFPLFYALASLTSTLNIGYRHLLPILPLLYVGIGSANYKLRITNHKSRGLSYSLLLTFYFLLFAWLSLGTLRIAPHYLPYFNELAGGPENGWRYLADSNTDWGQAYKVLAEHQMTRELGRVHLSAFTFYDPAAYGVDYSPIAPMTGATPVLSRRFNPAAGMYAISATTLAGVPLPYPPTFDWFRHREPFAKVGHAMFLYEVQPLPGTWIAQCSTPVAPLFEAAIEEGFGLPGLRRIAFDCEQSWVLPGGGATPGWFARAIPAQTRLRWPTNDALRADLLPVWTDRVPLQGLALSYLQPRPGELPAFAVWECAACDLTLPQPPIAVGATLIYHGMSAPASARPGATVDVLTFWEVVQAPGRPLSIMLHLRDAAPDSVPLVVGDGLGFPVDYWQAGDVFAQKHTLLLPLIAGEYTLHTGAYWLDALNPLSDELLTTQLHVE